MKITELDLADIIAIISSAIMILGTLSLFMKRVWRFIATRICEIADLEKLSADSSIKKEFEEMKTILKKLEKIDEKHKEQLLEFNNYFINMERALLRLEITQALEHRPSDKITIYRLYEDYKNKGGNHYIDNLVREWEKSSMK